jgi:hypothetical protein
MRQHKGEQMQELINNMTFMVVKGAINEGMTVVMVGGYTACNREFNKIRANDDEEKVFLLMEVDTWRTKK